VPSIREPSGAGRASTWIGAEGATGPRSAPFIQVGTAEDDDAPGAMSDNTYAFWSDRARHFEPMDLFPVTPDTEVVARLGFSRGRWLVSIRDTDSGRHARFSIRGEAGADLIAEWLQEDPERIRTRSPFPYPVLTSVRFRGLAVNGASPRVRDLHSQWMSTVAGLFRPTVLRDDAFAVVPGRVTPAGAQYLRIAQRLNLALDRFWREAQRWNTGTSPDRMRRVRDALIQSERQNARELESAVWPVAARRVTARLAMLARGQVRTLELAPLPSDRNYRQWTTEIIRLTARLHPVGQSARRVLEIPQEAPTLVRP
jgi:hypothetical protein